MRYLLALGVVALLMIAWQPVTASAAQGGIPPGSYHDTCKDIALNGDTLNAQCKSNAGHWHATAIHNFARCIGDITNVDGNLRCQKGGPPPAGSYTQTCKDVRIQFNTLFARCENADGRWVDSSLNEFSRCAEDIANVGGQLRCGKGRDRDPDRDRDYGRDQDSGPRGSYRESCRGIHVRGDVLIATCETLDGRWVEAVLDDYNVCTSEIVNDDGELHCSKRSGWSAPRGFYTETCRDIHLHGDILRARCQTQDGRWVWSQLNDWDSCGWIVNVDGQLRCDRDKDRDR